MAHYQVNINDADVEELAKLSMIGRKRAEDIVNFRDENGPFQSWEDLKEVPGIDDKMIKDLKESGATL